jgi:hypothetical protein
MLRRLAITLLLLLPSLALGQVSNDTGFPKSVQCAFSTCSPMSTASFTTGGPNRLMVAVVIASGYTSYSVKPVVFPVTVSGASLSWTQVYSEIFPSGTYANMAGVSIWTAPAVSTLTSQTVSVSWQNATNYANVLLSVYSLANAQTTIGGSGGVMDPSGSNNVAIEATLTVKSKGSYIVGGMLDTQQNTGFVSDGYLLANTTVDNQFNGERNSLGSIHKTTVTSATGSLTVGTARTNTYQVAAAVEIMPATPLIDTGSPYVTVSGDTTTCPMTVSTAGAGRELVVATLINNSTDYIFISDVGGLSWTQLGTTFSSTLGQGAIFYAQAASQLSGDVVTVTFGTADGGTGTAAGNGCTTWAFANGGTPVSYTTGNNTSGANSLTISAGTGSYLVGEAIDNNGYSANTALTNTTWTKNAGYGGGGWSDFYTTNAIDGSTTYGSSAPTNLSWMDVGCEEPYKQYVPPAGIFTRATLGVGN